MTETNIYNLTDNELERYSRHIVIPELGLEGQKKLKSAKVCVIGAGGLGSPVLLYLAAAGIGNIGIIDFDKVSTSNLQRQVLYNGSDIGKLKAEIAKQKLNALNPEIKIDTYNEKLSSENALDILNRYDIIVDGSDNFQTRYLVNDASVLLKKINVYGSIFRFMGQVTVFDSANGPCYRCLYPEPPLPGEVPSCEEAGVIGVLPGIIGSLQANEVIKIVLGLGVSLKGRLIIFDSLKFEFKELKFGKNPDCPICGTNPSIKTLIDYKEFCNPSSKRKGSINNFEISVEELKNKIDNKESFVLIDVREPFEKKISDIGGELVPMNSLPYRFEEFNKYDEIIVYCRTGHRSLYAVQFLYDKCGFTNVKNLTGGIYAWSDKIDSKVKKY
jgi:sulfur-carrier protein adenylyltransferase/sulfurtransferase